MDRLISRLVIGIFVLLYALVSIISTIHVIDFFELSNDRAMAITLAIAFEVGAAASLASLVILDKMNKTLVWALFITITLMQMQGNLYYAFQHLDGYQSWVELFNLVDEEPLYQKRVLSAVSGAILPLVALGFIKSLVDYIKPSKDNDASQVAEKPQIEPPVDEEPEPASDLPEEEPEYVIEDPAEQELEIDLEPPKPIEPEGVGAEIEDTVDDEDVFEDEDQLFKLAMERKAKEDMDSYLNQDQNDQ